MTDAEHQVLNRRIALKVGWHYYPKYNSTYRWREPYGKDAPKYYHGNPPDFTRKWEHAGPLLDLMCNGSGMTNDKALKLVADRLCVDPYMEVSEATAVAFDAWKEEKE